MDSHYSGTSLTAVGETCRSNTVQKYCGLLKKSLTSSPKLKGRNGIQRLETSLELNSYSKLKLWL